MAQQAAVVTRQDAQAARVLSRCVDRDVSNLAVKMDKHQTLLQALRETQVEQGQDLQQLKQEVRDGFADVRNGFAKAAIGQAEIASLLHRVIMAQPPEAH